MLKKAWILSIFFFNSGLSLFWVHCSQIWFLFGSYFFIKGKTCHVVLAVDSANFKYLSHIVTGLNTFVLSYLHQRWFRASKSIHVAWFRRFLIAALNSWNCSVLILSNLKNSLALTPSSSWGSTWRQYTSQGAEPNSPFRKLRSGTRPSFFFHRRVWEEWWQSNVFFSWFCVQLFWLRKSVT